MSDLANRLRTIFSAHAAADAGQIDFSDLAEDSDLLKPAAVLVPIIDAPRPRLLLTVRNAGLRAHAGQVAFPGGRIDPEDDGPIGGALREAREEIALPSELVDVVATARPYATGSGYLITPVIGVIPDGLALTPHEIEVARVFEVPLDHLVEEANHVPRTAIYNDIERRFFEITWPDERIWGVTAALIVRLASRFREAIEQRP